MLVKLSPSRRTVECGRARQGLPSAVSTRWIVTRSGSLSGCVAGRVRSTERSPVLATLCRCRKKAAPGGGGEGAERGGVAVVGDARRLREEAGAGRRSEVAERPDPLG